MATSNATHVDTVHQVEELLDAVLAVPALSALDLLRAVLEVFRGLGAHRVLALLSDCRGGLLEASQINMSEGAGHEGREGESSHRRAPTRDKYRAVYVYRSASGVCNPS